MLDVLVVNLNIYIDMETRELRGNCLKRTQLKVTIFATIIAITKVPSFALDSNNTCRILIRPGEYVRMKASAMLNLSCDVSSYEIDLNKMMPKQLWFWENNEHLDDHHKKATNTIITTLHGLDAKANNTYTCRSSQYVNLAEMKEVAIGDPPAPVQNFTCKSHDFGNWKCSFGAIERVPATYTAAYMVGNHKYNCPCINKSDHDFECESVLWRNTYKIYKFLLTSKNCFGEREQNYSFKIANQVIPKGLELRVINVSSTSAKLRWRVITDNPVLYKNGSGFVLKIKYRFENTSMWTRLKTIRTGKIQSELKLTGIFPYSRYRVEMQLKVAKTKIAPEMWKHDVATFHTLPEKPSNAPSTDPGGFYVDNSRCIHVFWRAFPKYMFNGTNFNYRVHIQEKTYPQRDSMEVKTTKYFYKHSSCEAGEYEFSVNTENNEGSSNRGNIVRVAVPSDDRIQGLPQPSRIRSVYNDAVYKLEWTAPEYLKSLNLIEYTIFTCSSKVQSSSFESCEDSIEFVHVAGNQTKVSLPGNERRHLIFAVSANYKQGSSGMAMSHCVPHENAALRRLAPKVDYFTDSVVKLKWSLPCYEEALVVGYILQYCAFDSTVKKCTDSVWNVSRISYDQTEYSIVNLKPFTNYSFSIKILSQVNEGPFSLPLRVQTAQGAPSPPVNLRVCTVQGDSAAIEWERPAFPNGIIRYYYVVINGSRSGEIDADVMKRFVFYNLTNLESYTTYAIEVKAVTISNGFKLEGQPSNLVIVRTRGRDREVIRSSHVEVVGDVLNISWDPPREYGLSSNTITYELKWALGQKWAYHTLQNETNYSVTCSPSKRIQIFMRSFMKISSIEAIDYPTRCHSERPLDDQVVLVNQSIAQEEHWLLIYDFYCDPDSEERHATILILTLSCVAIFLLIIFFPLYLKHGKMKALSLVVPSGLDDIIEHDLKDGFNAKIALSKITKLKDQKPLVQFSPSKNSSKKSAEIEIESGYMPMHEGSNPNRFVQMAEKNASLGVKINIKSSGCSKDTILVEVHPTAYVPYEPARPALTFVKPDDVGETIPSASGNIHEDYGSYIRAQQFKNWPMVDAQLALQSVLDDCEQANEFKKICDDTTELELNPKIKENIHPQKEIKRDLISGYVAVSQIESGPFVEASGYVKMEKLSLFHKNQRSLYDEQKVSKKY